MRVALAVFFAAHAASSALALGLPFAIVMLGRRSPERARALAAVALVNLSAAVVLGVAALLFVTRAWPREFVGQAVRNFPLLLATVPLLSAGFASLYAYQLRGWRPGPPAAGLAVLAVAWIFARVAAFPEGTASAGARLAAFVPGAVAATGTALLVIFRDGAEGRAGARAAVAGLALQAAAWALSLRGVPAAGPAAWIPWAAAAGEAGVLAVLAARRVPVTRFSAAAAAAGLFFVYLSMAALREAARG